MWITVLTVYYSEAYTKTCFNFIQCKKTHRFIEIFLFLILRLFLSFPAFLYSSVYLEFLGWCDKYLFQIYFSFRLFLFYKYSSRLKKRKKGQWKINFFRNCLFSRLVNLIGYMTDVHFFISVLLISVSSFLTQCFVFLFMCTFVSYVFTLHSK